MYFVYVYFVCVCMNLYGWEVAVVGVLCVGVLCVDVSCVCVWGVWNLQVQF